MIAPFIADFCCQERRLIIELDGSQHYDDQNYDHERSTALRAKGYRVIRFWNLDVMADMEGVLAQVVVALEER